MFLTTLLSLSLLLPSTVNNTVPEATNSASVTLSIPLSQIYTQKPVMIIPQYPPEYKIGDMTYIAQTFNNCGPASLSMIFDHFGTPVSQNMLAEELRPFNNPEGGVDDKAVFPEELVSEAKNYGYESVYRPEGSVKMLQLLVANDIPVIIRSWLDDKEDIGHYKIIKGYDSIQKNFIVHDSFVGPDQVVTYQDTERLWKPFNYTYVLIYPKEKERLVQAILGENMDEKTAWKNALIHAKNDTQQNNDDAYALFNQAIANYYLGDYRQTIAYFEKSHEDIPERMLWYQPEPIFAYKFERKYDEATRLADTILENGNTAFSELYQIKGDIYRERGEKEQAKEYYTQAQEYNKNYLPAREALKTL